MEDVARNLTRTEIKRLERDWRRKIERPLALLLDSVQSPQNIGAIMRTAAAFRVDEMYLAGASESPRHPKAARISLGTERQVAWTEVKDVAEAISQAVDAGYVLVGVELATGALPLPAMAGPSVGPEVPVCLVVGHETNGMSAAALAACRELVYIPTAGKAVPLNVSTAAAIAMYEVRRAEWLKESERL